MGKNTVFPIKINIEVNKPSQDALQNFAKTLENICNKQKSLKTK